MTFPENFNRLHEGEEQLRPKSIGLIEGSSGLSLHAELIECVMNLLDTFIKHHSHESQDELAIQCLGIRLFNDFGSSIKLMLSGYYQTATILLRSILETIFLLDYLQTHRNLISEWNRCDEKERTKQFGAVKIRQALDDRDGFTERKREKMYKLLCGLAAHPSAQSFRMLTPVAGGNAHCGPFIESTALEAVLSEMARFAIQAGGIFQRFFPKKTPIANVTSVNFMRMQEKWIDTFYGKSSDDKTNDLRNELSKALSEQHS